MFAIGAFSGAPFHRGSKMIAKDLTMNTTEKETFYIYHLKGIKIGCTINPKTRFLKNQRKYGKKFKHTILLKKEMTIFEASQIEEQYAKEYGYPNHSMYHLTYTNSMKNKESEKIKKIQSESNWLKNGKCTDEYRIKMSNKIKRRNLKLSTLEKLETFGNSRENNPAFGIDYNKYKTKEDLESIKIKKQNTNKINKSNHMHKGGNEVVLFGVKYKSINNATKILNYSFKYLKKRVESEEFTDCYFIKNPTSKEVNR